MKFLDLRGEMEADVGQAVLLCQLSPQLQGDFAFLLVSHLIHPSLLESSKASGRLECNSCSFLFAQSFSSLGLMTAHGVNMKILWLKATKALRRRRAWKSLVHVSALSCFGKCPLPKCAFGFPVSFPGAAQLFWMVLFQNVRKLL